MEKNGVVTAADNENATVTVTRDSACGENCAACGLCGNMREMTVNIKNTIGLREGDRVRLSSSDSAVRRAMPRAVICARFSVLFSALR